MASYYVWSGATGAGTGADWANAYTTIVAAHASKANGDVFWIAHDHAETSSSSISIQPIAMVSMYCVNRAGSVPPSIPTDLRTTATITVTGAGLLTINNGGIEWYGVNFSCAATSLSINTGSNYDTIFRSCSFYLASTSASALINIGSALSKTVMENCSFRFNHASQTIRVNGNRGFYWKNSTALLAASTVFPAAILSMASTTAPGQCYLEGIDFTGITTTVISTVSVALNNIIVLKNCKLGSGMQVCSTAAFTGGVEIIAIGVDTGTKFYHDEKICVGGKQSSDSTTIYRTGGAIYDSTGYSWKVDIPSLNPPKPMDLFPITIWNDTVGTPVTLTIEGAWASGTRPTNADLTMEVEYLGSSATPIASKATTSRTCSAEAATTYAAGSAWNGSPGSTWQMQVTFTPQKKGPVTAYIKCYSVNTFYIDPKPVLT